MKNVSDEAINSEEALREYVKANMMSAFIPVVWCPNCKDIRGEDEMVDDTPECIHCCN